MITTVIPCAGDSLYVSLDYRWGNTLEAFFSLTSLPMAMVFCTYGEEWRLKYSPKLLHYQISDTTSRVERLTYTVLHSLIVDCPTWLVRCGHDCARTGMFSALSVCS
jgi:hypothetical protein